MLFCLSRGGEGQIWQQAGVVIVPELGWKLCSKEYGAGNVRVKERGN